MSRVTTPTIPGLLESAVVSVPLTFHFDRSKQTLKIIQRRFLFKSRVEEVPQKRNCIRNGPDRFWERRAAGIGMATALELFGYLQSLAITAAQAGDNHAAGPAKQSEQHREWRGAAFQQLV